MPKFYCEYNGGRRLKIEADDHRQAYEMFLKEAGAQNIQVSVCKGMFGFYENFSEHCFDEEGEKPKELEIQRQKKFFCSSCGQKLEIPDDFGKDSVFCPSCGEKTQVPEKMALKELVKVPAVADLDPSKLHEKKSTPKLPQQINECFDSKVITTEEPKVIFWYKTWNAIGVLSLPFLFLVPSTEQEIEIMTIIIAIMFPIWFLHLFAIFLTSRSWHWGYGLFVIIIEVLNCYSWPITVPLICVWCSQNTRNWFKSLK